VKAQTQKLQLIQLDKRLQLFRDLPGEKRLSPRGGWISAIRKSLGISGSVLAQRMGISQSAEAQFEKSEKERNITLQTLEKVASALNADLVYAIVPRKSLQETLEDRALVKAKERVLPLTNSMRLEGQATSNEYLNREVKELQKQLLENPKDLWR
jgi:predicted DNA-binding mobile mystery protein A